MGMLSEIGTVLKSNIAINKIKTDVRDVVGRRIMGAESAGLRKRLGYGGSNATGITNANGKEISSGIDRGISDKDRLKSLYYNKDGSYNKTMIGGTIAGAYIGVSSAGRIATGGGLYRDSDGNFDLMGVPFI